MWYYVIFFFSGCKAKFDGKYAGSQIQLLDLSKKGETKVYWPVDFWNDKVKSFNIISITSYHDGSEINTKFLYKKGIPGKRGDGNWQSTIQVILYTTLKHSVIHQFFGKSCYISIICYVKGVYIPKSKSHLY